VLNRKGNTLREQGNYTGAIQYYNKALSIDPSDIDAINGKGDVYYDQSNYTEAIKYYDKALSIDPNSVEALSGKEMHYIAVITILKVDNIMINHLKLWMYRNSENVRI